MSFSAIDATLDQLDRLYCTRDALEALLPALSDRLGIGMSPAAGRLAKLHMDAACRFSNTPIGPGVPAMEAFGSRHTTAAAVEISLEAIGETIKKVFQAIWEAIKNFLKFCKEIFTGTFDGVRQVKQKKQQETNEKTLEELKKANFHFEPITVNDPRFAKAFYWNNQKNSTGVFTAAEHVQSAISIYMGYTAFLKTVMPLALKGIEDIAKEVRANPPNFSTQAVRELHTQVCFLESSVVTMFGGFFEKNLERTADKALLDQIKNHQQFRLHNTPLMSNGVCLLVKRIKSNDPEIEKKAIPNVEEATAVAEHTLINNEITIPTLQELERLHLMNEANAEKYFGVLKKASDDYMSAVAALEEISKRIATHVGTYTAANGMAPEVKETIDASLKLLSSLVSYMNKDAVLFYMTGIKQITTTHDALYAYVSKCLQHYKKVMA